MRKLIMVALLATTLSGCSALGSMAADKLLGSSDGIEATAQVGKENQKGLINTKLDTSKSTEVDIDSVAGDSNVNSGNHKQVTNQGTDMFLMVMAGALVPLLLLLYFIPSPRWLAKRHAETCPKDDKLE